MSMIDFPKIDSQGFFHDWNGFAMDRFNDPHLPSAGFTRRGVSRGAGLPPVKLICIWGTLATPYYLAFEWQHCSLGLSRALARCGPNCQTRSMHVQPSACDPGTLLTVGRLPYNSSSGGRQCRTT